MGWGWKVSGSDDRNDCMGLNIFVYLAYYSILFMH